jgi:hypothetical protein
VRRTGIWIETIDKDVEENAHEWFGGVPGEVLLDYVCARSRPDQILIRVLDVVRCGVVNGVPRRESAEQMLLVPEGYRLSATLDPPRR